MLLKKKMIISVFLITTGIFIACESGEDSNTYALNEISLEEMVQQIEKGVKETPEQLTPELKQKLKAIVEDGLIIKGAVVNKKGKGLPGVNIMNGDTLIAISDYDGNFNFKASEGMVVLFDYINLPQQKITIESEKSYKIIL